MEVSEDIKRFVIESWMQGALNTLKLRMINNPNNMETCTYFNFPDASDPNFEAEIKITLKRKNQND